nr:hypothetical protein B11C_110128 [Bartonella sp. 1-1C]
MRYGNSLYRISNNKKCNAIKYYNVQIFYSDIDSFRGLSGVR